LNNHDFLLTLIAQLDTKEKLRCLVNMGIELDGIQSSKGNTILEVIADDGSVAVFEELIEVLTHKKDDRISDLQEVFPENVLKSNKDKRDKIKLMINLGVSIESTDLFGQSALLLAVKDGDLQSIAVLLDAGANPDKKSYLGQTPLIISAQKLPLECFQSMLRHSELSQEGVRQDYKNIVLFAVLRSDIDKNEKLRAILKYYTNLEIRDENNQTPLVCALKQQESETIQMLISAGAKIELSHDLLVLLAYQSQAILQQAFSMQDFCSIINQPDTDGNTALIHAIKSSRDTVAKVWLLLESGADMTVSNHAGETAVLLALKYGHHEVLELFAAHRSQEYSALIAEIENESDVRSNYKIPAASQKKESLIFSESTKTASIPDRAISSSNQTGSV
jgi:ankyrin repeat protein